MNKVDQSLTIKGSWALFYQMELHPIGQCGIQNGVSPKLSIVPEPVNTGYSVANSFFSHVIELRI